MIYQSNVTDRLLYSNARAAMINAKISATAYDNAVKTQTLLRLIQPMTTGAQIIEFPVLVNQTGAGGATRADETRLPQQNAFFVGQWDVQIFQSAAFNYPSYHYPSSALTNFANMWTLYNGRIKVEIDQSVLIRSYSIKKFLQVPQTQFTAAANSPIDQYDGTAMIPVEPNVVLPGTAQPVLSMILPAPLGTIAANTFIVWDLFGIEAQNVCLGAIQ